MDSQWLKTHFDLNPQKTKAGLAKALGLEPPAVSKILKGSRQIKAHEYATMRRYFELPVDGENSMTSDKNSVVLKTLTAHQHMEEHGDNTQNSSWVIPANILGQHTQASPENIKIFKVEESLMEPDFKRGEHVVVDLSGQTPSPPGVFIVSDGFGYLIRQCEILPGQRPFMVMVSARDQAFTPQKLKLSEFKVIGRVIAKLQWL